MCASSTTPSTTDVFNADEGKDLVTYRCCSPPCSTPARHPHASWPIVYAQRWEIENAFDELKTHQRGPRIVLRSKSPDCLPRDLGHLCCHYAIRSLMAEAAAHTGHDPDRISFTTALRITRQTLAHPGAFPPDHPARDTPGWLDFLDDRTGSTQPNPAAAEPPGVVKRKYTKWHVGNAPHMPPGPNHVTRPTITIQSC